MAGHHAYLLALARGIARVPLLRECAIWAFGYRSDARIESNNMFDELVLGQSVEHHLRQLQTQGFSTGISLTPAFAASLRAAFLDRTLVEDGSGLRMTAQDAERSGSSAAFRWLNPHHDDPAVDQLVRDPRLIEIAKRYLGCAPILHSSQIWMLCPPNATAAQSTEYGWHYDIDDFRFLKLFFYLTDTAQVGGQHMLVGASHRDHRLHRFLHRRIPDEALRQKYAARNIYRMEGNIGDGFLEDTALYHRATPPVMPRIMIQVEYCATGVLRALERRL